MYKSKRISIKTLEKQRDVVVGITVCKGYVMSWAMIPPPAPATPLMRASDIALRRRRERRGSKREDGEKGSQSPVWCSYEMSAAEVGMEETARKKERLESCWKLELRRNTPGD